MLVTNSGKLIRLRVNGGEGNSIRVASRKTQGVRLFDVDEGEKVVSVALLTDQDDEDEDEDEEQDQDQDSNIDNNN
jgi:DNA gyrase subunit A